MTLIERINNSEEETNIERVKSFRERKRVQKMLHEVFYKLRIFQVRQKVMKNKVALGSTVLTAQSSMVDNVNNTTNLSTNTLFSSTESNLPYTNFKTNNSAHRIFRKKFSNNPFGFPCGIGD